MEKLAAAQQVGKIVIKRARCKGCGLCITSCPRSLIALDKSLNKRGVHPAYFMVWNFKTSDTTAKIAKRLSRSNFLEGEGCTGCALCAQVCPECCIEVYR